MMHFQPPYRRAVRADAPVLAELVNMAGEGLPLYVWSQMAEGGNSPWDIGRERSGRISFNDKENWIAIE
ncbi:MAG TPA: hypothetical protein VF268_06610 [Gammaproteobacteria bacterium]